MSSNSETLRGTVAAQGPAVRSHSYSRKRWNAFDAWQEHVRKSAATVGTAVGPENSNQLKGVTFVPVMSTLAEPIFP